jgi:hypothetical protein
MPRRFFFKGYRNIQIVAATNTDGSAVSGAQVNAGDLE